MQTSRLEQIKRWGNYVKNNPDWKQIHTEFINAQFDKHEKFISILKNSPNGQKKIKKLYH